MKNHMRTFRYLAICLLGLGTANVFGEMEPATEDELAELRESAAEGGRGCDWDVQGAMPDVLVSPNGRIQAVLHLAMSGAQSFYFQIYHERGGKWLKAPDTVFATRYADVRHIRMTDEALELTVKDEYYGITFTEIIPLDAEEHAVCYREARMMRYHPLHEAAANGNAGQIRALLASPKVNPRLLDFEGKYAWEVAANDECRTLLRQAAGEPSRAADAAATLTYLRSMNEDYAFQPRDLQTLEQMQGKGE